MKWQADWTHITPIIVSQRSKVTRHASSRMMSWHCTLLQGTFCTSPTHGHRAYSSLPCILGLWNLYTYDVFVLYIFLVYDYLYLVFILYWKRLKFLWAESPTNTVLCASTFLRYLVAKTCSTYKLRWLLYICIHKYTHTLLCTYVNLE